MFRERVAVLIALAALAMLACAVACAGRLPVILDDDGSADGMIALMFLLADTTFDVKAVTISQGEADPEPFARKLAYALQVILGLDIPVAAGPQTPSEGTNAFPQSWRDAANSFWGVLPETASSEIETKTAARVIVDILSNPTEEPVTILVTGTHTNVAEALTLYPAAYQKIARIVVMGGAFHVPGNIKSDAAGSEYTNEVSEWNIWVDPTAAREVLDYCTKWGVDIRFVPLDATNDVIWTCGDAADWRRSSTAKGILAADILEQVPWWNRRGLYEWDLDAAIAAAYPEICEWDPVHVEISSLDTVDGEGKDAAGKTIVSSGAPNAQVCLELKPWAFRQKSLTALGGAAAHGMPYDLADQRFMVNAAGFSPSGRLFASGSYMRSIWLYDVDECYKPILPNPFGDAGMVSCLAFSPAGGTEDLLAAGTLEGTIRLWKIKVAEVTNLPAFGPCVIGSSNMLSCLAFSPDGKLLAAGDWDGWISLWNLENASSPSCLCTFRGQGSRVNSLSFSHDGQTLASSSLGARSSAEDGAKLWPVTEIKKCKPTSTQIPSGQLVTSVAFSPVKKTLICGSADGMITAWDLGASPPKPTVLAGLADVIPGAIGAVVASLAFSGDGNVVAASCEAVMRDGKKTWNTWIWDLTTTKPVGSNTHGGWVTTAVLSPDGRALAVGLRTNSANGATIEFWCGGQ